jgi:hypothetical protein
MTAGLCAGHARGMNHGMKRLTALATPSSVAPDNSIHAGSGARVARVATVNPLASAVGSPISTTSARRMSAERTIVAFIS